MYGIPILPPLVALVFFAVWAIVLVLSVGAWRVAEVMAGRKAINGFSPGTPHGGDMYWRVNRAHMNTVENLPIFGTLVVAGTLLQINDAPFQLLPSLILYARIAQSLIHIASGSSLAVTLRFTAYAVQLVGMIVIAAVDLKASGVPLPW